MEALVAAATSAGERVKELKGLAAPKEELDVALAALLDAKTKITAIDPSHPLAIVDKATKKKMEKAAKLALALAAGGGGGAVASAAAPAPAASDGPSKKEAKKAAKKELKKEVKQGVKEQQQPAAAAVSAGAGAVAAPASKSPAAAACADQHSGVVYFSAQRPALATLAALSLCGEERACAVVAGNNQPFSVLADGSKVFGDVALARLCLRTAKRCDKAVAALASSSAESAALVDQWVDFSLAYPAYGDVAGLERVLEQRLATATVLVGHELTLADAAVWAALELAKYAESETAPSVARWFRLCRAAFARAAQDAASAPKAAAAVSSKKPAAASSKKPTSGGVKEAESATGGGSCPALEGAVEGQVVTRFPPEPSGFLHIGHAKAVLLNDYYARRYKGKLLIRFDDTNPSKEKEEYADAILQDLATLGVAGDYVSYSHTSDHFKRIETFARQIMDQGEAFMDNTPQEQMRAERETRSDSTHRSASVATNVERFEAMLKGEASEWCLRAKIDMTSDNGTLRDPVLFRANATPHHRTGSRYKAYPTYDFACPIVDSIEGVTHALRTTEYNDRDAQYLWLQQKLKLRIVRVHAFSRINFVRTLMSKRKLAWLVDEKAVDGWSDPRFPTIQGVVRRGVAIPQLREFIVSQGASRNIINLEWDSFWALNKAAYEPTAHRFMAVQKQGAATLTITNLPQYASGVHALSTDLHPKDPSLGARALRVASTVLLEADDAATIAIGEELVLMRWGLVRITAKSHDDAATDKNHLAFQAEFVPDGVFKKKRSLSWLARVDELANLELVEYDYLIAKPKLEEDEKLTTPGVLTPCSLVTTQAHGDPALKTLNKGDVVQLERRGFFRCDKAFETDDKPISLIYIPDGKALHKVPFSRLPPAIAYQKGL